MSEALTVRKQGTPAEENIALDPEKQLKEMIEALKDLRLGLEEIKDGNSVLLRSLPAINRALLVSLEHLYSTNEEYKTSLQKLQNFQRELKAMIIGLEFGRDSIEKLILKGLEIIQDLQQENERVVEEKNKAVEEVMALRRELNAALRRAAEAEEQRYGAELKLERREQRLSEVNETNRRLQLTLELDRLTGVLNQSAWVNTKEVLFRDLVEQNKPFCLATIDIDFFKRINDEHGHTEGDTVLKEFGRILAETFRPKDRVYRIEEENQLLSEGKVFRTGGEEFAIILPDCGEEEAKIALNRLRENLRKVKFKIKKNGNGETKQIIPIRINGENDDETGKSFKITTSIGIAEHTSKVQTVEDLFKIADLALYSAKRNGRDRIEIGEPEE